MGTEHQGPSTAVPLYRLRPWRGPCGRGLSTCHRLLPTARTRRPCGNAWHAAAWPTRGTASRGAAAQDPEDLGSKQLRAAAGGAGPNIEPRSPPHTPLSSSDVASCHGAGSGVGGVLAWTGSRAGARRGPSAPSTSGLRLRLRAPGLKAWPPTPLLLPPGRPLSPVQPRDGETCTRQHCYSTARPGEGQKVKGQGPGSPSREQARRPPLTLSTWLSHGVSPLHRGHV